MCVVIGMEPDCIPILSCPSCGSPEVRIRSYLKGGRRLFRMHCVDCDVRTSVKALDIETRPRRLEYPRYLRGAKWCSTCMIMFPPLLSSRLVTCIYCGMRLRTTRRGGGNGFNGKTSDGERG